MPSPNDGLALQLIGFGQKIEELFEHTEGDVDGGGRQPL